MLKPSTISSSTCAVSIRSALPASTLGDSDTRAGGRRHDEPVGRVEHDNVRRADVALAPGLFGLLGDSRQHPKLSAGQVVEGAGEFPALPVNLLVGPHSSHLLLRWLNGVDYFLGGTPALFDESSGVGSR